ncbi:anaerobic glycerol-3-phosphate dehydrogenase subunit C [Halorubellus sp. JP-L1]|uniref:anaerobic glycerol-3-phosphate dehydrogenase subunit C n=1 Tax=Halorubellus sp. JP-L1 TaxID=2715753 RepID=UPI00140D7A1F|nr:anaerobic glycerol-3-phosphate dehydrogenase subunit C [Halorubellus sp. JP-L1]NHN41081.1 anaerobic glycerol-3-phosphate dehydrogenase subunit C [Halorubellus sp. JP-L1]
MTDDNQPHDDAAQHADGSTADGTNRAAGGRGSGADWTDPATDGGNDRATDGGAAVDDGEFEPVQVFPEAEDADLRPGADDCYKCSTCDTTCPVAEVDEAFPGPKFQGPEQWRLKRSEDHDVDDSISKCSNCMRCDSACPSDVPLSQMHNTARAQYVDEQVSKTSATYWRNRLLANYGTMARLGSTFPRLTNAVLGNSLVQTLNERLLGITAEREFPAFATETFREWYAERGGEAASVENARRARRERDDPPDADKRVAYFHGDYANHNTPAVAKALVAVYESFGYAVLVPDQRCSGTPMFANGMLEDARRAARVNVENFAELVEDGVDVVCSCTSCSMALRQEYPELFSIPGTAKVAANTYDAVEYLRINEDLDGELAAADVTASDVGVDSFAYHAPCHARNQGLDGQTVELLSRVDGVDAEDVGDSCSGISGTYGWKTEHYDTSMKIGDEMFEHMAAADATTGMTECPTCAMQMEHGTGYEIEHPLEVLEAVLVDGPDEAS